MSARRSLGTMMLAMAITSGSACLLPPDGQDYVDPSDHAPVFELENARPPQVSVQRVPESGTCLIPLEIYVADVDPDDVLRIRWVADNDQPIVRFINEQDPFEIMERRRQARYAVDALREITGPLPGRTHTITLFVADGDAPWAATREEIVSLQKRDAGRIVRTATTADSVVISYTWVIQFESGECMRP